MNRTRDNINIFNINFNMSRMSREKVTYVSLQSSLHLFSVIKGRIIS